MYIEDEKKDEESRFYQLDGSPEEEWEEIRKFVDEGSVLYGEYDLSGEGNWIDYVYDDDEDDDDEDDDEDQEDE